jgi:hypothetical protein
MDVKKLVFALALVCAPMTHALAWTAEQQSMAPTVPSTLPAPYLGPLSLRLAEIDQFARQALPVIVRHCGVDAVCRKDQTAAMHELVNREKAIAKDLRNPTKYTNAVAQNDTVNACIVMWAASEDFVSLVQCINDASAI